MVSSAVAAGETEHFKIVIMHAGVPITKENVRMEVKVADAYTGPF